MFARSVVAGWKAVRLAALAAGLVASFLVTVPAQAETRTLKFYNVHNRERASFDYKRNGRYSASELKKINWFLRDWRKNKATTIDPKLLDLVWEAYRQAGARDYIHVISSYRSPATNAMLRRTRGGQAQKSQHMVGKALDFYIPGVSLSTLRAIGLKMQVGGVGFYPKSGSPFVHFDTGNARHWPRMSRKQLLALFPDGKTVHVPSDGKPLPGYQQALASYKSRRSASDLQVANASSSSGGGRTLLAMLFGGGGADEEEDNADAEATPVRRSAPPARTAAPVAVADAAVPTARPSRAPTSVPQPAAVAMLDAGFDTGRDARNAPARAVNNEAEGSEETLVAALDPSNVPVPRWAPARAVPATTQSAPAETAPAAAEENDDAVATMVAALEEQAAQTTAGGELAYAVPRPRDRPPFSAVLKEETVASVAAKPLPAATGSPATASASQRPAEAEVLRQVATVAPSSRPAPVAARPIAEPSEAESTPAAASAPAPQAPATRTTAVSPVKQAIEAAAPKAPAFREATSDNGKGGRVLLPTARERFAASRPLQTGSITPAAPNSAEPAAATPASENQGFASRIASSLMFWSE